MRRPAPCNVKGKVGPGAQALYPWDQGLVIYHVLFAALHVLASERSERMEWLRPIVKKQSKSREAGVGRATAPQAQQQKRKATALSPLFS